MRSQNGHRPPLILMGRYNVRKLVKFTISSLIYFINFVFFSAGLIQILLYGLLCRHISDDLIVMKGEITWDCRENNYFVWFYIFVNLMIFFIFYPIIVVTKMIKIN